jgi:transcriptional regulator with XRE-family HTH domain
MLKLKNLRAERHISQQKIARDLLVSQASISKYEAGNAEPDLAMVLRLAEYFHVSTDYLLGFSDIRVPLSKDDLSKEEIHHLIQYKSLSQRQRDNVKAYMKGILDENERKTNDKIISTAAK